MYSVFLLPWLLFGFLYCSRHKLLAQQTKFINGQHYYLMIIYHGTVFLILSLFAFLAEVYFVNLFGGIVQFVGSIEEHKPIEILVAACGVSLNGWILILTLTAHQNNKLNKIPKERIKKIRESAGYKSFVQKNGAKKAEEILTTKYNNIRRLELLSLVYEQDPFKDVLLTNVNKNMGKIKELLLIDLENDKFYIGTVSVVGGSDEYTKLDSFTLLIVASGYRDDKKKPRITTRYKDGKKSFIALKESNIASIKPFDVEHYLGFYRGSSINIV